MGTIQELPILERPREKALRYGIDSLSDVELLALVIGMGYHGQNAYELATKLLSDFNGLVGLSNANITQLAKIKGIKNTKAILISSIFEIHKRLNIKVIENISSEVVNEEYLYKKYSPKLVNEKQEALYLVLVNRRKNIFKECLLYKGTEEDVVFSYKEIWRELFVNNAFGFYLIHNHPNNLANPSKRDVIFTSEIVKEARKINIPLLDHLIIGTDGYYSLLKNEKNTISY